LGHIDISVDTCLISDISDIKGREIISRVACAMDSYMGENDEDDNGRGLYQGLADAWN